MSLKYFILFAIASCATGCSSLHPSKHLDPGTVQSVEITQVLNSKRCFTLRVQADFDLYDIAVPVSEQRESRANQKFKNQSQRCAIVSAATKVINAFGYLPAVQTDRSDLETWIVCVRSRELTIEANICPQTAKPYLRRQIQQLQGAIQQVLENSSLKPNRAF